MSAYRDLDLALTEWFNSCRLSHRIDSITGLSNGVLLKEFLSLLSESHFGKIEVNAEPACVWTERLKNLQRLQAAMFAFVDKLGLAAPKFPVDLVPIAISSDMRQLCALLEHAVFCVLNSPEKDRIITGILRLSQQSQVALMHFIKQVTQEADAAEFVMTPTREIRQLRKTQAKLSSQLTDVQTEYEHARREKEQIEQEYTEMKLTNTDLESKLVTTVERQTLTPDTIIMDLEGKLGEKEREVRRLREELAEAGKQHENSVSAYRDELDALSSRLESLSQVEQSAQVMRQTVEELKPLKEKLRLSLEENANLQRKVDTFQEEESNRQSISKQLHQTRESLSAEKSTRLRFEAEIAQKESHIKSLVRDNLELVEKIQFLESKNRELVLRLDQCQTESNAEDSFAIGTPLRELGEASALRYDNPFTLTDESTDPKIVRALDFWASDKSMKGMKEAVALANENRELKAQREELAEELATLRRNREVEVAASQAELSSLREAFRREVETLQSALQTAESASRTTLRDLSDQITHLTASSKASQMINSSLIEEIASLKEDRAALWEELAQLYREKDEMSSRFVSSRDETLRLNTVLAEKMVKISELESDLAQARLPIVREDVEMETMRDIEAVETGRKFSELKLRVSQLEGEIKQKDVMAGRAETQIKSLQEKYHHSKQKSLHRKSKISRLSRTKEELECMVEKERDAFQSITSEMVRTMNDIQTLVEVKTLMS